MVGHRLPARPEGGPPPFRRKEARAREGSDSGDSEPAGEAVKRARRAASETAPTSSLAESTATGASPRPLPPTTPKAGPQMAGFGVDGTRDVFSQPELYSPDEGFDFYSDDAARTPVSRLGMEGLALNSQPEGWPYPARYQSLVQSDGGIGSDGRKRPVRSPPPPRGTGGPIRTVGLRKPRGPGLSSSRGRGGGLAPASVAPGDPSSPRYGTSDGTELEDAEDVQEIVQELDAQLDSSDEELLNLLQEDAEHEKQVMETIFFFGAIDGTHVEVVVPNDKKVQYLCRKGHKTQNVLAVVDFDMRFTFVLAGWPGSVHDMRVFNDAINKYKERFPHPPLGKYYLVDSGYPNRAGYLASYKGTKYHLPEFRNSTMPRGTKETFNFAHSSLRNVVERAFGVLKMKWRMLLKVPSYPPAKQARIIVACMALHNFIRESKLMDEHFDRCDRDEHYVPVEASMSQTRTRDTGRLDEDCNINEFRDQMANALYSR
ncbi:uncharacterized protein LOC112894820 isoform X2 [Panicum hallii]|uniref:uncharacterized protein LOC112894820 isoform X2 n=1 Tax=Panicum hallii TaxID=206008 RepID=UPI000DF4EFED|nr:uncharacterized protein LOC112894820 isoform X2 [Panicum hallii]